MPRHREKTERAPEGQRLLALREQLGMTQRELATEFNVTAGAVAQWESGERTVPGPVLKLLELYELELQPDRGQERGPGPALPTGWLRRNGGAALASALWLALRPLLSFEESALAARTRLALARRFVRLFSELKGLSMKLGQMVSYMDFALPPAEAEVLASLEAPLQPMPSEEVASVVRQELGKLPGQLFAVWTHAPLATASIGQVHRARLASGEDVVVKIQYPKMAEALKTDLANVRRLDALLSLLWRGQQHGVIFEEVGERIRDECNYVNEARWQERFREHFAGHATIVIPEVVRRLSSARVLTTRFHSGEPLRTFAAGATPQQRERAALAILGFHWEAVFRIGALHADPHPGNLLFAQNGRIAFVDYGRVQELTPRFVGQWKRLIRATLERDREGAARVCLEMGTIPEPERFHFDYLYRFMAQFYRPFLTETFRFTPGYLRALWRAWVPENQNLHSTHYTAEMAFFSQITFGLGSVLARLDVEAPYRAVLLDLLYEPGEPRPEPFSATEVGSKRIPEGNQESEAAGTAVSR